MEMNLSEILDSLINAPSEKSSQYFGCFPECSGYATPAPDVPSGPHSVMGKENIQTVNCLLHLIQETL